MKTTFYTTRKQGVVRNSLRLALTMIISLIISQMNSFAQTAATSVDVTGTSTTNTITNNTATYVDPNLNITANGTITGFVVTITDSYTTGDILSYTGTLPSGVTAAAFNTTTRSLVFSGSTTAANWQTLMRTVRLQTTSATCFPESRKVAFIAGNKYYNPLNDHYYEYRSTNGNWLPGKAYAETQSYFGRVGYLATSTSQAENSFMCKLIGNNSWIGCSAEYTQINAAVGYTLYANQTASEGKFYWVVGPEKGVKVSNQNGGSQVIAGTYNNWAGGEPNNAGTEHYGHMYGGNGLWNDFANTQSIGSIIEYGGMPNDVLTSQVVFTRNIYINGAPSGTINGGNTTVCVGGSATLILSGLSGTVVRWEYSLDNFLTAGVTIANTTTTLSLTNITETRYYRAIVNSSSGCSNLATSSTPVYISNTVSGTIVAANNTICPGSNAEFTLFGNSGSVNSAFDPGQIVLFAATIVPDTVLEM